MVPFRNAAVEEVRVKPEVVARDSFDRKSRLEATPDRSAIERPRPIDRRHCLLDAIDNEAGETWLDELRHGTTPERYARGAVRHRLYHHQTERLGPIDRKQYGRGVAKESPFSLPPIPPMNSTSGSSSSGLILVL
jgi:hypothetical protein